MTGRRCLHSDSALNARKNIPSKTQIWKKVQHNCTYTFTKLWNNVQFLCCYLLISLPRVHTCWPDLPLVAERAFHCRRTSSSSLLPDPESPPPLSNSASLEQQQPPLHKSAFLQLPTARNSWPRRVQIWRGWQREREVRSGLMPAQCSARTFLHSFSLFSPVLSYFLSIFR